VLWVAGVIQLLNPGVAVEVQGVIDALVNGDNCSPSDALVYKVVLEYDGAKWHGDVRRDVCKMEALQRHRLDLIVRLRVGKCPDLPIDPKWCTRVVLVHTNSQSTIVQLRATVKAINEATAMNLTFDLKAMKAAVLTGDKAYKEIDTRTTAMITLLTTRYGKGAGPICNVGGVMSRLLNAAFVEKLDRVHAMCGEDTTRMCTFMCDSVAAALAGPDVEQFFQSVERIRAIGIVDKDLDTFVCDGVASRVVGSKADVDSFFVALGRLQAHPLGCKVPNMMTVMSDGVVAAIVGPNADAFFELLLLIKTPVCGNGVKAMCTFTSGSVATAMADHPEAFQKSLERLEREFVIKNKLLVTFMCNSAMSAMMHENADVFWTALGRLNKEFGIRDQRLATFMCDGVAKFIMEDTDCFFEMLGRLNNEFGIRDQRLVTFMVGGVAKFIREDADRFFKMLKKLKADFGVVGLVPFVNDCLSSAARGPKSKMFWEGMERLKGAMGEGGLASIMCGVVAKRTSSPEWVDAVIGVLSMTSEACVRALVYYSPVAKQAEAVHTRLQLLAPSKCKRFEDEVCKGRKGVKGKRVHEWLAGRVTVSKSTLVREGMERLKGALGEGGLASVMCDGVARNASSEKWVDAVIGVLSMTSEACVHALVYYSPVLKQAEAVHTRLQLLAPSERKRFENEVCKGAKHVKRKA